MRLGIDTYSLRWQGWSAFQYLEYSARIGLDNVHFSGRQYFESLDADYLLSLKRRADELGLQIEMGIGSFDRFSRGFRSEWGSGEEQLSEMLRASALVGSRVVRCFLGSQDDRVGPVQLAEHVAECLRTLKSVATLARELGVKIAVENHGGVDLLARELRDLVRAAGPDFVGVCLDTGNPAYAGEDPVLTTEILAPYAVTSHVRDNRVWATDDGARAQWVPMGQGNTDLRRIVAIMREKAPNIPIDLEIITGYPPKALPYLDPGSDFWQMFPDMPARDFARFVALARTGAPEPLDQLLVPSGLGAPPDDSSGDALRAQQLRHFEESVAYSRDVLGLGERGR